MAEVNFFLKKPKIKSETLVYLFLSYNNKRIKYSTGEKINPVYWNFENQRAKETRKFPEYPEFNARLKSLESKANTAYRKILNDGSEPTNELIKKELDKTIRFAESQKADLFTFIEKYIEESKTLKAKGTIKAYNTTLAKLKDYRTSIKKNFSFEDIDLEFYNSFVSYLTEADYSQNTIGKHIKILKTFLNEATDRGINKTIEYKKRKFKRPVEEPDKIYLSVEELERLYNLDIKNDKQLDSVRDLFVIGCFTGLRFSDFSELKAENILDGNKIKIRTNKTNDLVIIPLHKNVREIIKKYNNNIPKALSNPKMNLNLKHLGTLAKINDLVEVSITKGGKLVKNTVIKSSLICTHTARRSFATNLYLAGIPSITIMKITGHQTEKSFLRYIRISQEENANKLLDHPFFK
ncbi:MAG: site-specific integrase [Bacteroidia bacterium]|nr:site-specific integrase [Bacteroidia bacterium]